MSQPSIPSRLELRWDDVRVFLALYRERNLGAAGKRLALDASTASRRLAALEEALDTRLFDRVPEGLRATAAAERLLPAAEETEAGMLRFATAVDGLERKVEGVVRIATFPGLADNFLPPIFAALLAKYPGLRLEIDVSAAVADLGRREADLALRSIRPQSGDLVMTRLLSSRWVLMASPERAKRIGRLAAWNDVPWIEWGSDLAHIPSSRWLSTHAPEVRPVLRTSAGGAFVAAIEHDVGVGLMTEAFEHVRRIVPVRLAPALEPAAALWPSDDLWLVGHRALRDVPRIAAVWQFLLEHLAGATGADASKAKLAKKPQRMSR
jgi:DNA-binding transcriptional LysR family regulator